MRRDVESSLNKQDILTKYDQIEIFSKFLDIDRTDIEYAIQTNTKISSPFRTDHNPSVGFKFNNRGKLRMKDFAGYFWGDVFDLVAYILELPIDTKEGFQQILKAIKHVCENPNPVGVKKQLEYISRKRRIITVSFRDWNQFDMEYWGRLKMSTQFLRRNNCFPIQNYWIDQASQPEPKYYYSYTDPCYLYYIGRDKDNIELVQLYFPFRTKNDPKPRFITNSSILMGWHTLRDSDNLIITKSYKDVMAIHRVVDHIEKHTSFSPTGSKSIVTAIAVPSEQFNYTDVIHNNFTTKYNKVAILYDFDRTGIVNANKIKRQFGINPIFFTNGRYNTPNYYAKDFSAYLEISGLDATANLLIDRIVNSDKFVL